MTSESTDTPAETSGRVTLGWTIGVTLYGIEVVAVGFVSLLFGGLSVMLSDSCFSESTELICESRWQHVLAATPITALFVTVIAGIVLIAWTKKFWALTVAMLAAVLVPLLAFTIMQAVVTA